MRAYRGFPLLYGSLLRRAEALMVAAVHRLSVIGCKLGLQNRDGTTGLELEDDDDSLYPQR